MPETVSVVPARLAGRDDRINEPAPASVQAAAADAVSQIVAHVGTEVVLYGHCFGARVAFEAALLLERASLPALALIVSNPGPLDSPRDQRARFLDDESLIVHAESIAGDAAGALREPELRELLLPTVRADIAADETYEPTAVQLAETPILVARADDDHITTLADAKTWVKAGAAGSRLIHLAGDHMDPYWRPQWIADLLTGASHRGSV
jgi:surfactin synthase thioesterase subunit